MEKILDMAPNLERGQAILLASLSIAEQKLRLESEFQTEIKDLNQRASSALKMFEEMSLRQ